MGRGQLNKTRHCLILDWALSVCWVYWVLSVCEAHIVRRQQLEQVIDCFAMSPKGLCKGPDDEKISMLFL